VKGYSVGAALVHYRPGPTVNQAQIRPKTPWQPYKTASTGSTLLVLPCREFSRGSSCWAGSASLGWLCKCRRRRSAHWMLLATFRRAGCILEHKAMQRTYAVLLLALLLITGCGKPEDKFVGKYDGTLEMDQELIELMQAAASPDLPTNIAESLKSATLELELKGDGTYAMISNSINGPSVQTGTWTLNLDGEVLTLSSPVKDQRIKDMVGRMGGDSSDPIPFQISEDGRTLTFRGMQNGMSLGMTYTKK
ncbi:hypothetical protein LCGC14_2355010, partial [marine sediment metagenome]